MTATELVKTLAGHGVTLQPKPGGRLSATGSPAIVANYREAIAANKPALLAILAGRNDEARRQGQNHPGGGQAVTVHTPAGVALTVEARDPAHAEQLRAWNPRPAPAPKAGPVRCHDCRHATPTGHPALIDCAANVPAPGACGPVRWWADDYHHCQAFTPCTEETTE